MRVFGKLSFHILILLFAFFVNKEAVGANSKDDKNTVNVTDQSNSSNQDQRDNDDDNGTSKSKNEEVIVDNGKNDNGTSKSKNEEITVENGENEEDEILESGESNLEGDEDDDVNDEEDELSESGESNMAGDEDDDVDDEDDEEDQSENGEQKVVKVDETREAIIFFESFFKSTYKIKSPTTEKILFMQKVDHFDAEDDRTFTQRVYVDRYYETTSTSTVVLYVGQLKSMYSKILEDPTIQYLGQQLHAILYVIEHRYYGKSIPSNVSNENLKKYCNTEQALADIKNFITSSRDKNKKWIVYGMGHGGTLAGWFRLKYPDFASAAIVFAAPFHAMPETEYKYNTLKNIPVTQKTIFQEAFNQLHASIKEGKFDELKIKFKMCTKIDDGNLNDNVMFMYWSIINELITLINQLELPKLLADEKLPTNELDILAFLVQHVYEKTCFPVDYNDAINKYKNEDILYEHQINYPRSLLLALGTRAYLFQQCHEYGFFDTFRDDTFGSRLFGITFDIGFYTNKCRELFDIEGFDTSHYNKLIDTTNTKYGGRDIQATNIISIIPHTKLWEEVGMAALQNNKSIVINSEAMDGEFVKSEYKSIMDLLRTWTANDESEKV